MGQNVGQERVKRKPAVESKGDGLMLRRRGSAATWLLRIQVAGRRRDITIGPETAFSLRAARDAVAKIRTAVARGEDPRSALGRPTSARTLKEAVEDYIKDSRRRWRGRHEETHTRSQLRNHFGSLLNAPIGTIRKSDILPVLSKAAEKPTVYEKLLYRVRNVFTREFALGHIPAQPIEWAGLKFIITPAARKVRHHAAAPWKDASFLWSCLSDRMTPAAVCLRLVILTAVRSGEARGARWDEFDLKDAVWTIPGERTKTGEILEVPLSAQAVQLLRSMPRSHPELLFPGQGKKREVLSDMGLLKEQRLLPGGYTVHGWRSTFRDWAGETAQDLMLAELALGHSVGSEVSRAYARSTLRERRRPLMQEWADLVTDTKVTA